MEDDNVRVFEVRNIGESMCFGLCDQVPVLKGYRCFRSRSAWNSTRPTSSIWTNISCSQGAMSCELRCVCWGRGRDATLDPQSASEEIVHRFMYKWLAGSLAPS